MINQAGLSSCARSNKNARDGGPTQFRLLIDVGKGGLHGWHSNHHQPWNRTFHPVYLRVGNLGSSPCLPMYIASPPPITTTTWAGHHLAGFPNQRPLGEHVRGQADRAPTCCFTCKQQHVSGTVASPRQHCATPTTCCTSRQFVQIATYPRFGTNDLH